MSDHEFPPEVIEAAVISNIAYYAVNEFRDAHRAVVDFLNGVEANGGVSLNQFTFLMENVLLTLVHGRDYMRLISDKTVAPLYKGEGKEKYLPQKESIIAIATEDERIEKLRYLVREDLDQYQERATKEAEQRTEKIAEAFQQFLKGKSDEASAD